MKQQGGSKYAKTDVLALKAIFDEYDRDGSGDLDRHELTLALQRRKAEAERVDPLLSRAQLLAQRQTARAAARSGPDCKGIFLCQFADSLFETLDANSDSRITFEELLLIVYPLATPTELKIMVKWVTPIPTKNELLQRQREEAERLRMENLRAMFAAYDRNHDGKVSITEFRMAMVDHDNWDQVDELFEQYDANGNGYVDFDEFCAIVTLDE